MESNPLINNEPAPATAPVQTNENQLNRPNETPKLPWICVAISAIIAIAGLAFGIYGMTKPAETANTDNLKVQVKNADGTTTTLETDKIETTKDNGTTITIADTPVQQANAKDYVYIGEWGIKIKIPSNLDAVSYTFNSRSYGEGSGADYGSVCIYGVKDLGDKQLPSFWQNSGACVAAGPGREDDDEFWLGKKSTAHLNIDNTYFWVQGPQATYTDIAEEMDWEITSTNLIVEALKDSTNYSRF